MTSEIVGGRSENNGGENIGRKSRLAKQLFSPPLFSLYVCSEQGKAITEFKRVLHYFVFSNDVKI